MAARLSALPTYSIDSSPSDRNQEKISLASLNCRDKHVLELGCGMGLGGRAAGSVGGARSVTFTDINDQVLVSLEKDLALQNLTSECFVNHHLWASDRRILDHLESRVKEGDEGTPPEDRRTRRLIEADSFAPLNHWSLAKRDESIMVLQSNLTYDVILASDCLYFTDQEDGLGATLLLRMKKPGGVALVAFQTRGNNAESFVRLAKSLRLGGMHVSQESGPWDHDRMSSEHILGGDQAGGQDRVIHSMTQDRESPIELLTCSWAKL